jgi:hypothetical protein
VEVDRGQGPTSAESVAVPDVVATSKRVLAWRDLAEEKAAKYGVPASWILAFIFAESGGNPAAANFCCTGLMAIMTQPPVHHKTKAQMLDPEQNVDYGASLLAQSAARAGNGLPEVASIHVAGPKKGTADVPKTNVSSPWGMSEHMWLDKPAGDGSVGYIDRVVRANNMFVRLLAEDALPPVEAPPSALAKAGGQATPLLLGVAVGFGALVGLRRWLDRQPISRAEPSSPRTRARRAARR